MTVEWLRYCQSPDLVVDDPYVDVDFGDNRSHRVTVEEHDDEYVLSAFVVRQAIVSSLPDLPVRIWLRNRALSLVGFRIDHRGRLVGETWLPKTGITNDEFQLYVRTLATECDRFEYILTGRDAE